MLVLECGGEACEVCGEDLALFDINTHFFCNGIVNISEQFNHQISGQVQEVLHCRCKVYSYQGLGRKAEKSSCS